MDQNLQGVLLFHNHQAMTPNVPFSGNIAPATTAAMGAGWGSGGGYGQPGSGYPAFGQIQSGPAGGPGTGMAVPVKEPPPAEPDEDDEDKDKEKDNG